MVRDAILHVFTDYGRSSRGETLDRLGHSGLGSLSSQPPADHVGMPKVSRPYPWRSTGPK